MSAGNTTIRATQGLWKADEFLDSVPEQNRGAGHGNLAPEDFARASAPMAPPVLAEQELAIAS